MLYMRSGGGQKGLPVSVRYVKWNIAHNLYFPLLFLFVSLVTSFLSLRLSLLQDNILFLIVLPVDSSLRFLRQITPFFLIFFSNSLSQEYIVPFILGSPLFSHSQCTILKMPAFWHDLWNNPTEIQ